MPEPNTIAPWHPDLHATAALAPDTRQRFTDLITFDGGPPSLTTLIDRTDAIARLARQAAPSAWRFVLPPGPGFALPLLARAAKAYGLQPLWAIPPATEDGLYTLIPCF